jgi:hypothetical protein
MTAALPEKVPELITNELAMLWAAHRGAGLKGYMCLFSPKEQVPFRSKQAGVEFWFSEEDTQAAIELILQHYNQGMLPNTTLLLNPIVHEKKPDGTYVPIGSGIIWCTSLCLGVDVLKDESASRVWELGVHASTFHRGENDRTGLKVIAFCDEAQRVSLDKKAVSGCKELYDIVNISSDPYAHHYLLSGISYLTNHGLFQHPNVADLFPQRAIEDKIPMETLIKDSTIHVQKIVDAAYCWNAYERHHSLYQKFGTDPDDVQQNLGFFNLVARDIELFDATGPMRKDADEMFEFIVPGLVPRGSVTLLAAAGGTGKSSLAHQLCIMTASDYDPGEEAPQWLGQRVAIEKCKGISIYFSGEDGPAIINARASIFDPKGHARRLMFQRTDFGDGITFTEHLKHLYKIPDVPIRVIDPARKFLTGDENDSGAVSEFFEAIEEFAHKKNAAVLVVHHLEKGASPKSAREVLDMIRGSQVFIDRSRVIIGMFRDGPYSIVGLAKNNIPPNMGMVSEERVFARDSKHLQLVWLPGHQGVRNANLTPEELEEIISKAREEH